MQHTAASLREPQPRLRRERMGELIQIDGSDHHRFEDRADPCTLLVFIDDATSTLMELRFVKSESAFGYFAEFGSYHLMHGRPVAFYSDKHSAFRSVAQPRTAYPFRGLRCPRVWISCAHLYFATHGSGLQTRVLPLPTHNANHSTTSTSKVVCARTSPIIEGPPQGLPSTGVSFTPDLICTTVVTK